jgi:hypothetical protein
MVSVVTATVTVGALRTCWGTEHRHAGVTEPACAMHHGARAPVEGHGHHGHGPDHTSTPDSQRITCNCSNDAGEPLVVPHAIVVERTPHLVLAEGDLLASPVSPRLPDFDHTPLSPPPRSTFS